MTESLTAVTRGAEAPVNACPRCGVPMTSLEVQPGIVPAPTGDAPGGYVTMERAAKFDSVKVMPCGHAFLDAEARAMVADRQRAHEAEAARVLASNAAVLGKVRALPGPGPTLVARYEVAVRAGSRDACGLLAAILVIAGEEPS